MPTPVKSPEPLLQCLLQLMEVAGVITAFPKTTLSGVAQGRFKTALGSTYTNRQFIDEQGNLLAVTFTSAQPVQVVLTPAGKSRLEREATKAPGL